MAWKKVSDELSAFLENKLASIPCDQRRMFGCPVWFVNNNMFAGVHQDSIMLRLSADDQKELYDSFDEAAPFEPMPGRKMKEYVSLPETVFGDDSLFDSWIERSFNYVSSLPPKEKKKKK